MLEMSFVGWFCESDRSLRLANRMTHTNKQMVVQAKSNLDGTNSICQTWSWFPPTRKNLKKWSGHGTFFCFLEKFRELIFEKCHEYHFILFRKWSGNLCPYVSGEKSFFRFVTGTVMLAPGTSAHCWRRWICPTIVMSIYKLHSLSRE